MKGPIIMVDQSTGVPVEGIASVMLAVGKLEGGGVGSQNFMASQFTGGAEDNIKMLDALGSLIGHVLYLGVIQGLGRAGIEETLAYLRHRAEHHVNQVLATGNATALKAE